MSTEVASRDTHGGEGRIKAARFPARKTLEEFDFTFQRSVKKTVVEHLGQLIAGGGARHASAAAGDNARAVTRARSDIDRWVNEGGSVPFEAAALIRATTRR